MRISDWSSDVCSSDLHLQAHVKTLRLGAGALFVVALLLGFGWWSAPKSLTIHVPPDLRSGSTRKWWDVPPESVYAFRSEEHTSELQSLMRISYAVFCLKKKKLTLARHTLPKSGTNHRVTLIQE